MKKKRKKKKTALKITVAIMAFVYNKMVFSKKILRRTLNQCTASPSILLGNPSISIAALWDFIDAIDSKCAKFSIRFSSDRN